MEEKKEEKERDKARRAEKEDPHEECDVFVAEDFLSLIIWFASEEKKDEWIVKTLHHRNKERCFHK